MSETERSGVELTPGLEARVLARLAVREQRAVRGAWVPGMTVACAVLAVAVGVYVAWPSERSMEVRLVRAEIPKTPQASGTRGGEDPAGSFHVEQRRPSLSAVSRPRIELRVSEGLDALAQEEMRAPTLASPPAPLTAQERLLQQASHRQAAPALAEAEQAVEPGERVAAPPKQDAADELLASFGEGLFAGMSGSSE
jgi:hypothetical protein